MDISRGKLKKYKNRDWLYRKYCVEKLSIPKIADLGNNSTDTIYRWMKKFNIETRKPNPGFSGKHHSEKAKQRMREANRGKKMSLASRKKMSKAQMGEKNNRWKGGRKIDANGYVYILKKDHPKASWDGYVAEHRLVMEKVLGRYLRKGEIPHHKNEVEGDNRPENLEILSPSKHTLIHINDR